jgi:NAD(P)-dependent dehydrogenase (short-subunit alcohol dehydrogenase family)
MEYAGKTVVVTGGAQGIGAALVRAFLAGGADVWVFDLMAAPTDLPAGCQFLSCDVSDPPALEKALDNVVAERGQVDIFVSNASVLSHQPGHAASAAPDDWQRCWAVNVMAHVHAARHLLPTMMARGAGHFVIVASAAGLLNQIGDAAYSATKHAAVSFAESLAISHADDGVGVTLVCPQYVATPMIGLDDSDAASAESLMTASEVADCVLQAVSEGRFLVLPHEAVRGYAMDRAQDHDRWIGGMRRLRARALDRFGDARPQDFYKLV